MFHLGSEKRRVALNANCVDAILAPKREDLLRDEIKLVAFSLKDLLRVMRGLREALAVDQCMRVGLLEQAGYCRRRVVRRDKQRRQAESMESIFGKGQVQRSV